MGPQGRTKTYTTLQTATNSLTLDHISQYADRPALGDRRTNTKPADMT